MQLEWSREILVLVSLVDRRCYCSRGALLLFFPGRPWQDRIIQHFTVADHPWRFGRRSRRQPLVALGGTARCCHRPSPTAGYPGGSLRAVLPSPVDSAPELSLTHSVMKIEVAPPNATFHSAQITKAAVDSDQQQEIHFRQSHNKIKMHGKRRCGEMVDATDLKSVGP